MKLDASTSAFWDLWDLNCPLDISIPMQHGLKNPRAFSIDYPVFMSFQTGNFVGDMSKGSSCNVVGMQISPHGNGTHTECVGHIGYNADGQPGNGPNSCLKVNTVMSRFWFPVQLVSVNPVTKEESDPQYWITQKALAEVLQINGDRQAEGLVVRTLPNDSSKLIMDYSETSPAAFEPEALAFLASMGILHLLTDLPSVDPEHDQGQLLAHKAFWCVDSVVRNSATITEMIYVPSLIPDGAYLLNLMLPNIALDAVPSRPILYPLRSLH
ncbi:MAG: cyclase family protein [Sphingomonadales bacterium]|nr:cyclase family protein [Sphingomonadales bacterium]